VISAYAVPEHVVFADEIPKTSAGKIDKRRLRQEYVEKPDQPKG
jgi:acyl-CoA synthetase (AMP-forming)/AMP-acid ligase II